MKKTIYAIAALAFAFIGCTKEYNETFAPGDKLVIRAEVNDALTKVAADNSGKFSWQAGDAITVLNTGGKAFNLTTATEGAAAAFTTDSFEGTLSEIAYYPASTSHKTDKFFLEPTFTWKDGETFMPMIGTVTTSTKKVSFKTAGAVIKLVCYNVPADARKLVVSSDSKKLSGLFTPDGSPAAIVTAGKGDSDNTITITFGSSHPSTMIIYVPVPTGNLGKLTFVMKDGSDAEVSLAQTTKDNIHMTRQHIVAAPVLNCSLGTAFLTNSEIKSDESAVSTSAYGDGTIKSASGDWLYKQGRLITEKFQMKKIADGGYLVFPSFGSNIASITFHSVTNGGGTAYSGNILFYDKIEDDTAFYTFNESTTAGDDVTINLPSGHKTAVLKTQNVIRFDSITVLFEGATYTAPSIVPSKTSVTFENSGGNEDINFEYSNPFDENAVAASVEEGATWLTASVVGTTLKLTASANTGSPRSATVTLRATGVSKQITVNQDGSIVINTYVFTNKSWAATLNGGDDANWTSGKDGNGYTAGQGVQVTTGVTGANATSPVSFTNVSEIVVTYNTNKSTGEGTIKVKVGTNAEKSSAVAYGGSGDGRSADYTTTFTFSPNQSGKVLLTTDVTTNSLWIKSIKITAASAE